MMSCREVYNFLDAFLEGRLGLMTRMAFGAHLLLCRECRNYLATYKASIEVARTAEMQDESQSEIPEELIAAILASRPNDLQEPRSN